MKRTKARIAWLLIGALPWAALAITTDASNPYGAISKRNAFDLKPIPVVDPNPPPPPPPPPANFKLLAVIDSHGSRRALFSVQQPAQAPKQPGQPAIPASTESLMINEGDTRGSIKLVKILNVKSGEMEIENNGVAMKIDFRGYGEKLPATGPVPGMAGVPGMSGMPIIAGVPAQPQAPGQLNPQLLQATGGRLGVGPNPGAAVGGNAAALGTARPIRTGGLGVQNSVSFDGAAIPPPQAQPEEQPLTREAQIIMMEIERERTKAAVSQGLMPPIPPTAITPVTTSVDPLNPQNSQNQQNPLILPTPQLSPGRLR